MVGWIKVVRVIKEGLENVEWLLLEGLGMGLERENVVIVGSV